MKKVTLLNLALIISLTVAADAAIRKGPYLIYPGHNTEMMVLWQLGNSRTCTLEWGVDTSYADGNAVTSEYGADHQHKYLITDLTPACKYYYRLTVEAEQYTGSFRAAPPEGTRSVKFLAYGDTRTNVFDHDMVNEAMFNTFTEDPNYQTFTMLSGDWVDDGEEEADWTSEFFNPAALNTRQLQANLPINGCIGNHEWESGDTPPTYFDKYWPYPYVDGFYWSFDYGPAHITVIDQYEQLYTPGSEQYDWIVQDLASTDKEWKFIQLHEPGYSAGGGHDDAPYVQDYIQPLCEQYAVDMVVAGHNHYYARCNRNGVIHITTGGGGAPLRTPNPTYSPHVQVAAETYHFCKINIQKNELHFEAVTPDANVVDTFTLTHPKVQLTGPPDGAVVDAAGAVFSCLPVENATAYQLAFGPDPERLKYVLSETAVPPNEVVAQFPCDQTWWNIRVRTSTGRTLYADAMHFYPQNVVQPPIHNTRTGEKYTFIQHAIDEACHGDTIVVAPMVCPMVWQHLENIDFKQKSITLTSINPHDPAVVAATVINGGLRAPAVTLPPGDTADCSLIGLTITKGNKGVYSDAGNVTVKKCLITANNYAGVYCSEGNLTVIDCNVSQNNGPGLHVYTKYGGTSTQIINSTVAANAAEGIYAEKTAVAIANCAIIDNQTTGLYSYRSRIVALVNSLIAGNRETGIRANGAVVTNCTIVGNKNSGVAGAHTQIRNSILWSNWPQQLDDYADTAEVIYSNIQDGWPGLANLDSDPCFVAPGYWGRDDNPAVIAEAQDPNSLWVHGDCTLRSCSPCVDSGNNTAVPRDVYDLDGDTNQAEPIPFDLDGNTRIYDADNDGNSVIDRGAYEFSPPPLLVLMKITPQALNPQSRGNWVKAHLLLHPGFALDDVDVNTPAELLPLNISSVYLNGFINEDGLVELEVAFDRSALCTGSFQGVVTVQGLDTIRITPNAFEYVADFALHWLESNCADPDWCDQFDLDRNSVVNLVDFASLHTCRIEVVEQ